MEKSRTTIYVFVLICALAGSGALFALNDDPIDVQIASGRQISYDDDEEIVSEAAQKTEAPLPMHTITADFGPLVFGLGVGLGLNAIPSVESGGWGIGAQYEFQPFRYFSIAGKFSYMGMNMGIKQSDVKVGLDFSSYSIEGHLRWYPWGKTFFLDGMGGYANFKTKLDASGLEGIVDIHDNVDLSYFKVGGELGWRIDFGKPGGFVFETAVGYFGGFGPQTNFVGLESISKLLEDLESIRPLAKQFGINIPEIATNPAGMVNGLNDLLANLLFVGGPKVTLALGWRF